jgi:4-amino-4-deoxy-L-arabinose transferase-like glycosyltransferase
MLIVDPAGNFPLNDDWTYARPVSTLLREGKYEMADVSASTVFVQAIWGALFCVTQGFSFTAVRISTLTLGIIGIAVIYLLINRQTGNRLLSFIISAFLMVNPMYFSLSYTFMTDIPFLVFSLLSVFFFHKCFEKLNWKYLAAATLFSCMAVLTRQLALFVPIAYALSSIFTRPGLKLSIVNFTPAFISVGALIAYVF